MTKKRVESARSVPDVFGILAKILEQQNYCSKCKKHEKHDVCERLVVLDRVISRLRLLACDSFVGTDEVLNPTEFVSRLPDPDSIRERLIRIEDEKQALRVLLRASIRSHRV